MTTSRLILTAIVLFASLALSAQVIQPPIPAKNEVFPASHRSIQYTGRVDFSIPKKPKFWAPGVYIQAKFLGTHCTITVLDEVLYGTNHNTIAVTIDDGAPVTYKLKEKTNKIKVADKLVPGEHVITICKNTEAGIGYIELLNIVCEGLLPMPLKPTRKIEFIGNSITCGSGVDVSSVPCDKGQWYDQHNAYMSYGPVVARTLKAQYHLSAVSGIGLIQSCCNMNITMPQVFDKINQRENSIPWNFSRYQPDVVTVTLGQNDGVQDSTKFCTAYVNFIGDIRSHYPKAHIVCLTSPMADEKLKSALKQYINGVVEHVAQQGDKNVSKYFYSRSFNSGCGGHPDLKEHQLIAKELSDYLAKTMGW
ncbi:SGNH/GDSL hydrolase family protein [Pseudochryseolinea flava]|uniref:Acetyl xylan esterase n=1 Tax=Pseudochryseolinea flava TaxID=2059302 RepID=A0A364XUF8_9BACT|nr:SGNH/GDSL hydrolase family protein [Pseudochryseolinea flava]RAV97965.1 acetyl xylan esterase [Pseudochryseolinea flava]